MRALYRVDVAPGSRGDAGHALQEIEGDPLAGEDRPSRSGNLRDHLAPLDAHAVADQDEELDPRIEEGEGAPDDVDAGNHTGFLR